MRLKSKCNGCHRKLEIEGEEGVNAVICPSCGGTVRLPQTKLEEGEELGDFRIKRHIGSGSMGDVYLATQVSMERDVAIKVLPPEIKENQESLNGFLAEVRTLAKLDHPNIVTAFQAGEANGLYFLAMTYVDGGSLEDRLEAKGPLPEGDAIHICLRVAQALRYAWDRFQIIHRDIKPENIMIDALQKQPKILDLGISKMIGDDSRLQSESGLLVGTPHYMSPEQANASGSIDFRSDMYSLGCTLFALLTGNVPFDGTDPMKVLIRHIHDPVPDPLEHNPTLHSETADLINQLMSKNAGDRFSDWTELIDCMKGVLNKIKSPGADFDTNTQPVPRRRRQRVEAAIPPGQNEALSNPTPKEEQGAPPNKVPLLALVVISLLLIASMVGVIGLEVYKRMDSGKDRVPDLTSPVLETRPLDSAGHTKPSHIGTVRPLRSQPEPTAYTAERFEARVQAALSETPQTPTEAAALIGRLEKLLLDAQSRPHSKALKERLHDAKVKRAFLSLKARAVQLCKQGRGGKGRRLVTEYSGPFAKETAADRKKLYRELMKTYSPRPRKRR